MAMRVRAGHLAQTPWVFALVALVGCWGATDEPKLPFGSAKWVAYSPTGLDPTRGKMPSEESLKEDLKVLRGAGFTGLVTYGCAAGVMTLPRLAREAGFTSFIQGIWSPTDTAEIDRACELAADVAAYGVGNEGLGERYSVDQVKVAIGRVKEKTGKPATTTEQVDDYLNDPNLLQVGDWIFPNAHPYWHDIRDAREAVTWTQAQYDELKHRAPGRPVLLKEVGFPTAGDPKVGDDLQAAYYQSLAQTNVRFVYFEAFDLPWKRHAPVEPYWGLFRADRSPKKVVTVIPKG